MRELSEIGKVVQFYFERLGASSAKRSGTSAACRCFSVVTGQAMMGELRGYADAASFGHWVKRQNKNQR